MASIFNTSTIHGSVGLAGPVAQLLTRNISWIHAANPWNYPGARSDNQTHLTCLTNNATLQDLCCETVGGQLVNLTDNNIVENITSSNGQSAWCALPEQRIYNDHYNTQPALVDAWAQCYNSSVNPANNPGRYRANITISSDVWQCELKGNYSGSNQFIYPDIYEAATTNSASTTQLGRFSLLTVAGVISVATLAASTLAL